MYHSFFNTLQGHAVIHAGLAVDGMIVSILQIRQIVTKARLCSLSSTACALINTHASGEAVAHLYHACDSP